MTRTTLPEGVSILGALDPALEEVLTPEALALVARLQREFGSRRESLLDHAVCRFADL